MFTSMFLQDGIFHILFNMWALWAIGGFMEAALGRLKFVLLYFISGFAGSVLVLVAAPTDSLVVGASGAIFGIFGALAVHAFLNRGRDFQSRALLGNVIFLLVINLVFTFSAGRRVVAGAHRRAARRGGDDGRHDAGRPQGPAPAVRHGRRARRRRHRLLPPPRHRLAGA